jgi:hypothetical protein
VLESAWFQSLPENRRFPGFKLCFKIQQKNVYRYNKEVTGAAAVGVFITSALVVLAGVVVLGTYGM